MSENRYMNYQGMLTTVSTGIAQLGDICEHMSMPEQANELGAISQRLKNHVFSVGILGEFKRGKSTIINALLGQNIVPADIVPCSATLNYIRWDANKRAEVKMKDGTIKEISVDELSDYVTKITKESEAMAANVESATVYYPCQFCQNGVQIVDTPGLNDDERMTAVTENVVPMLDAIIMVIVPDAPFSQSEAEFVRNKLLASDLGKLIFVVNKIDIVDEDEVDRVVENIKQRISESVLDKMLKVYGEDSEEYKNAKAKIGEIKVIPVSARKALKGKIKNDAAMIEASGYIEFEKALSKMLVDERGIIQLLPPANKAVSTAKTILENIETRYNALKLDAQEYEKILHESMDNINETREKKKLEIESLMAKGKTLYADLLPGIDGIYSELYAELESYAQEYSVSDADVESETAIQSFSEKFSKNIDSKIIDYLSIETEKLTHKIREQIGSDAQSLEAFNIEVENSLENIRKNISASATSNSGKGNVKAIAIDAGTLFGTVTLSGGTFMLPGVGGVISGFKEHGLKGGVVGGLTGAFLSYGAIMLGGTLGIVGLPLAVLSGVVATFGGKSITNLIFGKKQPSLKADGLKQSLVVAVKDVTDGLRNEQSLENWLQNACDEAYEWLAKDIDKEWELAFKNMENTLTQIKIDIGKNTVSKELFEKEMNENIKTVDEITGSIEPIRQKLITAINS